MKNHLLKKKSALATTIAALSLTAMFSGSSAAEPEGLDSLAQSATISRFAGENLIRFSMVPSGGAAQCVPHARGRVTVLSLGGVELMQVDLRGLPPETPFVLFNIQLPNAPFGLSWYQGDVETNKYGRLRGTFLGRFNEETFIVAPDSGPAPLVHHNDFPDVDSNPPTGPVHVFHLGLWFDSPEDAAMAGCPDAVTPFNGDHTAGIQVMNTGNFPDVKGPLGRLKP